MVASPLDEEGNAVLRALPSQPDVRSVSPEAQWEFSDETDVLIVVPTPQWRHLTVTAAPPPPGWPGRLRLISSVSAGIDVFPRWLLDLPEVACGRGISTVQVADYAIAAIFHAAKNLDALRVPSRAAWETVPLGSVAGSTIGIVGFGDIGQAIARRALALGAKVLALRRSIGAAVPGVVLVDLVTAMTEADHLVLALPATSQTRNLIDAAMLARMKPTAHLINVGRGAVLDHAALNTALGAGRPARVTPDVTEPEPLPVDHPLWRNPRALFTPHVSTNYTISRRNAIASIAANLERFARGNPVANVIDKTNGF